jgi:hypothetical protein
VLPAASVARTSKVWGPSLRLVYSLGDVQTSKVLSSILHSNVDYGSEDSKEKLTGRLSTDMGVAIKVVSGGVRYLDAPVNERVAVCERIQGASPKR